ncbi:ferredoxin [Patescibacteria group bacterium]
MSISVNKDTCIGCGACASLCPDNFQMNDDNKSDVISQEDTDCAKNAAQSCPVQAIIVE